MGFPVYNVHFRKTHQSGIFATGEVTNESSRKYAVAMFKIVIFDKFQQLSSTTFKVYDFYPHATREFEVLIEDVDSKAIPSIMRYETVFEGGY